VVWRLQEVETIYYIIENTTNMSSSNVKTLREKEPLLTSLNVQYVYTTIGPFNDSAKMCTIFK